MGTKAGMAVEEEGFSGYIKGRGDQEGRSGGNTGFQGWGCGCAHGRIFPSGPEAGKLIKFFLNADIEIGV